MKAMSKIVGGYTKIFSVWTQNILKAAVVLRTRSGRWVPADE